MATFDFTSPEGKTYSVDGPEGATSAQAFQILQQHLGTPAQPQIGMGEDAAKSIGSGLANATASTLGAAGDLRTGLSAATDYLGNKAGIGSDKVQAFKDMASKASGLIPGGAAINNAPTSRDVINSAPDPIVSPDYQPQYESGRLLKKGAEFAPGLLAGEGGVASRLLSNVALPAIGSEVGEKVAGPLGGIAGAVVGGVGGSAAARKFQQMAAARQATNAIPSAEDLLASGSKGFEAVKAADTIIKPSSIEQMAKDIKTEMLNEGKHPTSEGQSGVFAALDRLEEMGAAPGGVTPKDMEVIRRNLSDLKTNQAAGPTARMATDKFMEKYSNLGDGDLMNGSNPFPTLKNAIGDWAAAKRSQTIEGKRNLAELNANTPVGMLDSGAGGQALQRTMKQLARPMNNTNVPVARKLGFNNEEIGAIDQAASGNKMTHTAELMDRLIPAKLGAIPAAIARQIGGLSTKRQVTALDSLVRSRSPLANQVAAQLPPQIVSQLPAKTQRLLRALAVSGPAVRQQISQAAGQTNPYQGR